jgi:ribose-5-phosphate isomerase (EC 5.3.1.6)
LLEAGSDTDDVRPRGRIQRELTTNDARRSFDQDAAKTAAAVRALDYVDPGMRLGLGTGSTASAFIEQLSHRVADGLDVVGVPTSERTAELARSRGIRLATLDELPELDLTIDGADEFDGALRLIKGGGGALLREKITATASRRMIVIADASKKVATLGRFPLPVEVNKFGLAVTHAAVRREAGRFGCEGNVVLRRTASGADFVTDGGTSSSIAISARSGPRRNSRPVSSQFPGSSSTVCLSASRRR